MSLSARRGLLQWETKPQGAQKLSASGGGPAGEPGACKRGSPAVFCAVLNNLTTGSFGETFFARPTTFFTRLRAALRPHQHCDVAASDPCPGGLARSATARFSKSRKRGGKTGMSEDEGLFARFARAETLRSQRSIFRRPKKAGVASSFALRGTSDGRGKAVPPGRWRGADARVDRLRCTTAPC